MLDILPFANTSQAALHGAMCAAFSDYIVPMQPTPEQFRFMLRQRGFNQSLSWVARSDGEIVGFWLLGSHGKGSSKTAYVIATGTHPAHRGRGIATRVFESLAQDIGARGFETLELEVIDRNTAARKAYEKLGFAAQRDVICYKLPLLKADPPINRGASIGPVSLEMIRMSGAGLWDWQPTWQNSLESLDRIQEDLEIIGVYAGEDLLGYGAVIRSTSTLAQLAVRADRRRQGIGRSILAALASRLDDDSLQIINASSGDEALAGFVARNEGTAGTRQIVLSHSLPVPHLQKNQDHS